MAAQKGQTLAQVAAEIAAILHDIAAERNITRIGPWAKSTRRYVVLSCDRIGDYLSKAEALTYLAWLREGNRGTYRMMLSKQAQADEAGLTRNDAGEGVTA